MFPLLQKSVAKFLKGGYCNDVEEVIYKARKFTLVKKSRKIGDRLIWGEYLIHPGAVAILAVQEGHVLFVRQFRPAVGEWTLEIPAGTLEPGEDLLEAAVREMVEETGYKPLELKPLGEFYPTPGVSNELIRLYYSNKLEYVGVGKRDLGEIDMEIVWLRPSEVLELIERGVVKDSKTIIAFFFAMRKGLL